MILHQPLWMLAMGLIPVLLLRWVGHRRRSLREWHALGRPGTPLRSTHLAWVAALGCVIVALARPSWGRLGGPKERSGRDVVLVVDTSRSMGCEDAIPNRLGVSVASAETLVKTLGFGRADRSAVVAFAGRSVTLCPLTENLGAVVDTLHRLRPGDVSPGGSNLGRALAGGLNLLDQPGATNARILVVFSDGEDHDNSWHGPLTDLVKQGVVVFSIAVGDPEQGALVPDGFNGWVTWNGKPVRSKRQDNALRTVSESTGGRFFPAGRKPVDLTDLGRWIEGPKLASMRTIRTASYPERFPAFLGIALGLSLWASRVPWRSGRLLGVVVMLAGTSLAATSIDARNAVDAGCEASRRGDRDSALALFETAIRHAPEAALPRYDAGLELEALGRFEDAARRFEEADRHAESSALKAKIAFARGNTLLALGQIEEAILHYEDCLERTRNQPSLAKLREDAEINQTFAIEHRPPPPQTTKNNRPDGDSPDKKRGHDGAEPTEPTDNGQGPETAPTDRTARPTSEDPQKQAGAQTPEQRLESALDKIHDARARRRTRPVSGTSDDNRKDW